MVSEKSSPESNLGPAIKKQKNDLAELIKDSRNYFHLWFANLVFMLLIMMFHRYIDVQIYVVITTFLFIYLWVLLLAKLDQLASRIEKIPHNLVYKSLLIPVLGTFVSYHFIQHHAVQITRNSR
jgi:Ca2+/Na+ antiporter